MSRVEQFKRENMELPPDAAVDAEGNVTRDPNETAALLPFGAHKGYGLSLVNELVAALIGGSLPTLRCRWIEDDDGEKRAPCLSSRSFIPMRFPVASSARSAANLKMFAR